MKWIKSKTETPNYVCQSSTDGNSYKYVIK